MDDLRKAKWESGRKKEIELAQQDKGIIINKVRKLESFQEIEILDSM